MLYFNGRHNHRENQQQADDRDAKKMTENELMMHVITRGPLRRSQVREGITLTSQCTHTQDPLSVGGLLAELVGFEDIVSEPSAGAMSTSPLSAASDIVFVVDSSGCSSLPIANGSVSGS